MVMQATRGTSSGGDDRQSPAYTAFTSGSSPFEMVSPLPSAQIQQGSSSGADPRVMSPRNAIVADAEYETSLGLPMRNQYVLDVAGGFQPNCHTCQVCNLPCVEELAICGMCGRVGHYTCLQYQFVVIFPSVISAMYVPTHPGRRL